MSTFRLCRVITAELHAMVKWNIKHRVERLLTSLSWCVDGNTTAWRSQVSPGKASRSTRGVCRRTSTSFPFSPHHWHHSGGQLSDNRWVGNQPSRSWSQWHGGVRGRWHLLLLLLPHPPWLLPLLLCVTLMQKSRHHVGNAQTSPAGSLSQPLQSACSVLLSQYQQAPHTLLICFHRLYKWFVVAVHHPLSFSVTLYKIRLHFCVNQSHVEVSGVHCEKTKLKAMPTRKEWPLGSDCRRRWGKRINEGLSDGAIIHCPRLLSRYEVIMAIGALDKPTRQVDGPDFHCSEGKWTRQGM